MTQPKFTEAKAAWDAILAGMQPMGMESEAINTVDEYFSVDANWSRIVDREREVDDWLVRQLEAWPIRVDPERTTNIVFLMNEAAKRLRPGINPAALASNSPVVGEDALPAIGPDPMKADGPRDLGAAEERLKQAYVKQQTGVPDQTALVWRVDLGDVRRELLRLRTLANRKPAPTDTADRREAVDRLGRLAGRIVANGEARISRLGACHELDAIASLIAVPDGMVRTYTEEQRQHAITELSALRDRGHDETPDAVDTVAEALGLRIAAATGEAS